MISIVVPAHNERDNLRQLADEVVKVCEHAQYDFEMIFVDDGSTDDTWWIIQRLAERDKRLRGVRFGRRYGKSSALSAGFRHADGEILIQMDGDLQDDPAEIPRFVDEIEGGYDLIVGFKQRRHDSMQTVAGSRIYNYVASRLTGVNLHDHNCGYKAYRASILRGMNLYGEMHRHIPAILAGKGARTKELVVNHRPRKHGRSKYGSTKAIKGLLDLMTVLFLTTFRQRPLHFLGGLGLISFALGFCGLAYLAAVWFGGEWIGNRPLLVYSLAGLLLGFQLFATGILAELVTYYLTRPSDTFFVAEYAGKIPFAYIQSESAKMAPKPASETT